MTSLRPSCYRWGLTIDITSMNVLIISVGLCVDFCAHIVHGFLTGHGTKGNNLDQGTIRSRDGFSPQITNCLKNSDGLLQSATWWTTHRPPDFVWTSRGDHSVILYIFNFFRGTSCLKVGGWPTGFLCQPQSPWDYLGFRIGFDRVGVGPRKRA